MTKEELIKEYVKKMQECVAKNYDPEVSHINADNTLVELLDILGYGEVTFEYNNVKKCYA